MKIVGLITEYNPFHNGHKYHIDKAKEEAGADYAVVVMSGNFVQRGAPAIMPKQIRASAALQCGADVVIELPVYYATASAEQFAFGAVSILHHLGCVDSLCFGSESGDISLLQNAATVLFHESGELKEQLKQYLKTGITFPAARKLAYASVADCEEYAHILDQPNNILGIEYLKALFRLESSIEPIAIKRISSEYHDQVLKEEYSSATAIRNHLQKSISILETQVPSEAFSLYEQYKHIRYPITANDFSLLLKYKLLTTSKETLQNYLDVSEELANAIHNNRDSYLSYDQFCELLKTKNYTYSRINRALLHILLEIRYKNINIPYARILGFRRESAVVLKAFKEKANLPIITKPSRMECLNYEQKELLDLDIHASNLYESVVTEKFKTPFINEYKHAILRI